MLSVLEPLSKEIVVQEIGPTESIAAYESRIIADIWRNRIDPSVATTRVKM